jgi:HAD superfamily hydrolase (TIGR01459 family)
MHAFSKLTELVPSFSGILLDAFGVFWGGDAKGVLPGAKEAMEYLVSSGKIVGVLSNSTQLPVKEMHKISSHGLVEGTHYHFFVTSGEITRKQFLKKTLPFETPHHTYWVLGDGRSPQSSHPFLFEGSDYQETPNLEEADFIYLTIPRINNVDQLDPEAFLDVIQQALKADLPLLCPNPDRFVHEGDPVQVVVRQGGVAELYKKLGGLVFYIGKPYDNAFAAAMERFHTYQIFKPEVVLMVGDTPETDIRGARAYGMSSLLITGTGMMAERIRVQGFKEAVLQLPEVDHPDFFIERFAL